MTIRSLRVLCHLLITGAVAACGEAASLPAGADLLARSRQHVLVLVERDGDSTGFLYRFHPEGDGWRGGTPIPVSVGAAGVAKSREGDRRAPSGVYPLTASFGYDQAAPSGVRLPYLALRPETECVDDADSPRYNQIVNPSELPGGRTWTSSEMMRRDIHYGDELYKLGVVVGYNPGGARDPESGLGAGSCIFLHIWRGPDRPTVGCTALPEESLREIIQWLDPEAFPVLVQGSRAQLEALEESGALPYAVPASVL